MMWHLIMWSTLSASALSADGLLNRVQERYAKGGAIEAHFEQAYFHQLRQRTVIESGMVWTSPSGQVHWQYQVPTVKDFIFDGQKAFFYEPENAQVTTFRDFGQSPLWRALKFLLGVGAFADEFSARLCESCKHAENEQALLLKPKKPIADVKEVQLIIKTDGYTIAETRVFDGVGNHQTYRLKKIAFNADNDTRHFRFDIPEGVHVQIY